MHGAGQECDTDLCKGCARGCLPEDAAAVAGLVGERERTCANMQLRFRQHKRVAMGKSDLTGWGSFLMVGAAPCCLQRSPPQKFCAGRQGNMQSAWTPPAPLQLMTCSRPCGSPWGSDCRE